MFSSLLIVFSTILTIAWSFPFLIAPLLGLRFYIVSDSKVVKLLKRLPKYSSIVHNEDPEGWIVGWPFIGYIYHTRNTQGDEKRQLYLFTRQVYFTGIMQEIETIDQNVDETVPVSERKKPELIDLYEREGCYAFIYYSRRVFDVQPFEARPQQKQIIQTIMEDYETRRHSVVILYGEKGVGKSMIPILLAKELSLRPSQPEDTKVNFCDTHKPTDPGDHFGGLYQRVDPSRHSPLVVVFEEFDGMICEIHHQTAQRHQNVTTAIYDKASWNQFFDRFDRGYYPWTILLMTSNQHPDAIHRMDPSYIRKGRVNLTFEVMSDASVS